MIRRILILRTDNIGDAVLFSGFLATIRRRFPDSRIDLCVQSHVRNLFGKCPYVDRVITEHRLFPWRELRRTTVRGAWALAGMLQSAKTPRFWYPHYDLVICPISGSTEEQLDVIRKIPAREKWGFGGVPLQGRPLKNPENTPENVFTRCYRISESAHWISEMARTAGFLRSCGIETGEQAPEFWLTEEDVQFATATMPALPVLGIFPGSTSQFRRWPIEKWVPFVDQQAIASRIVIFGSKDDQGLAREIMERIDASKHITFLDLSGKTTLRQLASCLRRCSALVSMETSGLHMAVACGIPTVGLMGGHHYGRYYPWGNERMHRVAHADLECFPCREECWFKDYRCVSQIPVATVLRELDLAVKGNCLM